MAGILDVEYDYERARQSFRRASLGSDKRRHIWRYEALLPTPPPEVWPGMPVGNTPLVSPVRLREHLGIAGLQLKVDGLLPTGSLKDRASVVAVADALARGADTVAGASTGNAASSVAGLCAAVGLRAVIFVPSNAPPPKLAQLRTYGAHVAAVEGSYDQAYDLCLEGIDRYGWYSRNTAHNPVLSEGKKTVVFEIFEQRSWRAPDWIVVPVGDGCIMGGVGKGIRDLLAVGMTSRAPRILGVQAEGSAAIYKAWRAGSREATEVTPDTLADSISVGHPRDAVKALRAVRETDGLMVTVSDRAILEAGHLLGSMAGIFAEPAASAALAGLIAMRERGEIRAADDVAVLITGLGLKDPQTAARGTPEPISITPDGGGLDRIHSMLLAPTD